MGNTLNAKPQSYSGDWKYGEAPKVYGGSVGGSYMASYRQNSTTADSMQFGTGKVQFGVKMLQDIQPGPMQGQMFVVNNAGKRLYFTYKGQIRPDAGDIISQGKNAGNGPAVAITGNPMNPQYHMFYSPGGSDHKSDDWQSLQINSKADVMQAMTSGMQGADHGIQAGAQYANYFGQASVNPFAQKTIGGDMWTTADRVGSAINDIGSKLIIPMGESFLDDFVPGASTLLGLTGINAGLQHGIDSLMKASQGKTYQSTKQFDPQIANSIKDPRLSGYLTTLQDQSHQFIAKYGDAKYQSTQKLAQDTPSQMLEKAKQLSQENEDYYVQSEVQQLTDLSTKLQGILKNSDSDIYSNIKTGLQLATTNKQKMNVINHFSTQIKNQLLPLLQKQTISAPVTNKSPAVPPVTSGIQTASAVNGHPSLSINGHDSRVPTQHVISGNSMPIVPTVPM